MLRRDWVPSTIRWRFVPRSVRRQCIRRGWDQYQLSGWKHNGPHAVQDPRRWLWQNGMEGAQRYQKDTGFRIEKVEGWA